MPSSQIVQWGRIKTRKAKIRRARPVRLGLSLPSPREFFAFLFTERLFTTILEPGTGYATPVSLTTIREMFCNHWGRIKYWTLNLLIVIHSLHSLVTKNTWLIFSKNVIHLTKGTSEKQTNKQTKTQGPSTGIRMFLKTDIFSPFYSPLFTRKRRFRNPKRRFLKTAPRVKIF